MLLFWRCVQKFNLNSNLFLVHWDNPSRGGLEFCHPVILCIGPPNLGTVFKLLGEPFCYFFCNTLANISERQVKSKICPNMPPPPLYCRGLNQSKVDWSQDFPFVSLLGFRWASLRREARHSVLWGLQNNRRPHFLAKPAKDLSLKRDRWKRDILSQPQRDFPRNAFKIAIRRLITDTSPATHIETPVQDGMKNTVPLEKSRLACWFPIKKNDCGVCTIAMQCHPYTTAMPPGKAHDTLPFSVVPYRPHSLTSLSQQWGRHCRFGAKAVLTCCLCWFWSYTILRRWWW